MARGYRSTGRMLLIGVTLLSATLFGKAVAAGREADRFTFATLFVVVACIGTGLVLSQRHWARDRLAEQRARTEDHSNA